jgi:hypothetical protein
MEGNKNRYNEQEIKQGKGSIESCEETEEEKDNGSFFEGREEVVYLVTVIICTVQTWSRWQIDDG